MKNLYLKAGKAKDIFNDLKDNFKGTLTSANDEYNLTIQSNFAKGNIKGIPFSDGMTYMQFEIVFYDDVRLSIESFATAPIFFGYCLEGTLQHSFGIQGERKIIKKQQTAILKSTSSVNSILHFEKNKPLTFYVVQIETNTVAAMEHNRELVNKLKRTFFNSKKDYLNIENQSVKITHKLEELNTLTHKGIVGNLFINRILEKIIAIEIEEHTDGFALMVSKANSFVLKQIDEIQRVSNNVKNATIELFTTDYIIQRISLFTNKWQRELKTLINRTVHGFLIYVRIERERV